MTVEEKLQHFLELCMTDARSKSGQLFDEYRDALEKSFDEHKQDVYRRARMRLAEEEKELGREKNKKLALAQMNARRMVSRHHDQLKEKLFAGLREKLEAFIQTPEYTELLKRQVSHAQAFSGQEELIIYLDPADQDKLPQFVPRANDLIKISEYSFGGGIRAVIPARHILIDHSFDSKIAEEKEKFRFKTGGSGHGSK